ncbi:hypothetical protein OG949_41400 (plasmid) [Streptomyces scopuliridis]|uniref:hypothetical protein n=1 Tax=Streptomyces scopuliridis TaxID=452529 RepID=UPI002DD81678|nr:hypothetical protein [Streptomyces scopuliridis]WSB39199.1 hypothetical protein OG949_41400 [Streptomyces scopuliridis]
MDSPIDELLSRARLLTEPYTRDEVDAAEQRLLARMGAATDEPAPAAPGKSPPGAAEVEAARDLRTLCEAVVARTGMDSLSDFISRTMPEPLGARVLGCILQLKDSEEAARFWWQYAAGAGDPAASYCLYLHHRGLGEHGEARWWHKQTRRIQARPPTARGTGGWPEEWTVRTLPDADVPAVVTAVLRQASMTDASLLPTTLRILNALKTERAKSERTPVPAAVGAVLDYVPAAVGYVDDDLDLPLPDPDFTDHIRTLTAMSAKTLTGGHHGTLPARSPLARPRITEAHRPTRPSRQSSARAPSSESPWRAD